ncbi:hypothetical protein ACP275_13G161200 [Erythranthe tilingii]
MNLMKSAMFNLSRRDQYGVVLSRESRRIFHNNYNNNNNNNNNYYYYYSSQSKSEITQKVKESMHNSTKKTGGKFADASEQASKEEPIMEGWKNKNKEDEDEMKKKFAKDPGVGGKPIDEDQGLDVNWRPFDDNKS